jgi:hypothetical protein
MRALAIVAAALAAHFPAAPGWHTRVGPPRSERPACGEQRSAWAATDPLRDGAYDFPPHRTIATLPPDGIVVALFLSTERCNPQPEPTVHLPLDLRRAHRSGFPGPRGDELPLYSLFGRRRGRYTVELRVIFGRRHPTKAQRAAAQREISGIRWPAHL